MIMIFLSLIREWFLQEKIRLQLQNQSHLQKKKLKPNEFWSPNPFEMYKKTDDSDSKEEKVKTPPTNSWWEN